MYDNPNNLPIEEFFNDRGDLYEGTEPENIVAVTIGGKNGLKFTPYVTNAGGDVYIIPIESGFLEIFDPQLSSFVNAQIVQGILQTIKFK